MYLLRVLRRSMPKAAIIMSTGYETADYHREDLIYDKNRLLKAD